MIGFNHSSGELIYVRGVAICVECHEAILDYSDLHIVDGRDFCSHCYFPLEEDIYDEEDFENDL